MAPFRRERIVIPASLTRDSNPPVTNVERGDNMLGQFTPSPSAHGMLSYPLQRPAEDPNQWAHNDILNGNYSDTYDSVRRELTTYPSYIHHPPQPNQALHANMNMRGLIEATRTQQSAFRLQPEPEPPNPEPLSILVPANFSKTCEWRGCHYTRPFHREADLLRHLKSVHISPDAYPCGEPGCGKAFGRRDNLAAHRQRVHG